MPRGPRLDTEGALHHVMGRGIERREIFRSDEDRQDFLTRIAIVAPSTDTVLYSWALLPNHFHLFLRSGTGGVSTFMRRLLTGYAVAFNRRHRRVGHLFQNRYKSVLVEEETYFLELVRYVHLNPLRAKVVKTMRALDAHPWTGHAVIMGNWEAPWQDAGEVLARFGREPRSAVAAYREFVSEGISQGQRTDLSGGGLIRSIGGLDQLEQFRRSRQRWQSDERVLGSGDFVKQVLEAAERQGTRPSQLQDPGSVLTELLQSVAKHSGVGVQEVLGKGRRSSVSRARRVFCRLAVTRLGVAQTAVARFLDVTPAAVNLALTREQENPEELENRVQDFIDK